MKQTVGAVAIGIAILIASACDGSIGTASPTTTGPSFSAPSTTATAASPIVAAQQGGLAAYRGMWDAYERAGATANPDHPDLVMYADGAALQTLRAGLQSMRARGLVSRGSVALAPEVVSLTPADEPTEVGLRDCADTSKALLYRANGDPQNDTPGGRRLVNATATLNGGVWKVTSFGVREVGSC